MVKSSKSLGIQQLEIPKPKSSEVLVKAHFSSVCQSKNIHTVEKSGIVSVNNVIYFDPKVSLGKIKTKRFGRELSRYNQLIQHYFVVIPSL